MHPQLRKIAEQYGVPLSDRSCHNSYMYDGKTLATTYQKENWDEDFNNLLSLSDPLPIPDDWMAHEIAHYVVADSVEREFPEYGCAVGIVGFGSDPLWNNSILTAKQLQSTYDGVLTREEQDFREICADLLGTYWCKRVGIRVEEKAHPVYKLVSSLTEPKSSYSYEMGWRAIIWLRENNLME